MNWKDKVLEKFNGVYDFSETVFGKQKERLKVSCMKHGEFETTGYALVRNKVCCPICIKNGYKLRHEKARKTNLKKYGVENPMQVEEFKKNLENTIIEKYGVKNVAFLDEIKEARKKTNLKNYGATSYIGSEEGKKEIEETNLKRYGAKNFMLSSARFDVLPSMIEKSKNTQLKRYGATHYSKSKIGKKLSKERKAKEIETKKLNGTLNTSKPEEKLYEILIQRFREEDVLRQFKSDLYPFYCDFYIKSLNLYIELNVHWTHGEAPFVEGLETSEKYLTWVDKSDKDFYKTALYVWTELDVLKRKTAQENDLNYIIFWDAKLRDAEVWLSMGCPNGRDYNSKYTWFS